jgi:hypothetical protein
MSLFPIKQLLVIATVIAGATGGQAFAQDLIDINVPFDFVVGSQTFHAGTYVLTMNAGSEGVMLLRGDRGKAAAFVMTGPASGHDPAGQQPALVFNRYEKSNVLSQIWENAAEGREVVTPRSR